MRWDWVGRPDEGNYRAPYSAYKWKLMRVGGWSRQDAGWSVVGKKMLSPAANPIFYTKQAALPIFSLFLV